MIYSLLRETKREPRISRNGSSIIMGATLCLCLVILLAIPSPHPVPPALKIALLGLL